MTRIWHRDHVNTKAVIDHARRYSNTLPRADAYDANAACGDLLSMVREREEEIDELRVELESKRVDRWHATANSALFRPHMDVASARRMADEMHGPINAEPGEK